MRGGNSFCIIVTSKYNNQAFKKAENNHPKRHRNLSEGNFSAIYVIIKLAPSPTWTCTIYPIPTITNVFLNPPSLNPSSPPCLDWDHNDDNVFHSPPPLSPPQCSQTRREVTAWVHKRRNVYPATLMNPVQDMESTFFTLKFYSWGQGIWLGF